MIHEAWCDRLLELGRAVRAGISASRDRGDALATAVAQEGGDTIFAIDRHVEPIIEDAITSWPVQCFPLELVAEGMGEDGQRWFGGGGSAKPQAGVRPAWKLLVDPIDGTRNIMYDKRSAWFIAAVMPGERTSLVHAVASAIVELPTTKAGWADEFAAAAGGSVRGSRRNLHTGAAKPQACEPSAAGDLRNGFAQVSNFFPGTKVLASELMERIVHATLGEVEPGTAAVFDDQYITTAGQMVELMVGHDRFCCDLRPLFYDVLSRRAGRPVRGLECHPYDLAGMLVAQRAGVILTDGLGRPLDAPLDVHSPVHWCGYANRALQLSTEPVIQTFFREHGVLSP